MNNLTLATALLASTAALCYFEHTRQQSVRAATEVLNGQLRAVEDQLAASRVQADQLQKRLAGRQSDLHGAEADLAAAEQQALQAAPPEPDPAKEGAWPAAQPYFYLAKSRLKDIGYPTFMPDDQVSSAAAGLFAMTPQERAAVDAAARDFRHGLDSLELEHAQKLESTPSVNTDDHREISFQLSAVTNGVAELKQPFEAAVTVALGAERAGLFLDRAGDWSEEQAQEFRDADWTITFRADRKADGTVDHRIQMRNPQGNRSMPVIFPLQPSSALWRYTHFFGDQPLLSPSGAG